jgi:hypothetical protein
MDDKVVFGLGTLTICSAKHKHNDVTDMSSPLKTRFSRVGRYDRDFQRSEFYIQTPESLDYSQLPGSERSEFRRRTPEARDCSQRPVPFMLPTSRPVHALLPITTFPPQCIPKCRLTVNP